MNSLERFAGQMIWSLGVPWIPEGAEVTATRNDDGTITVAWDQTFALNQRGEVIVVDGGWVPAAGGSVTLAVVGRSSDADSRLTLRRQSDADHENVQRP